MRNVEILDVPELCAELVNILRAELVEYGGLLNLLKQQQEVILDRDADQLMEVNRQIEEQAEVNSLLKESRLRAVRILAKRWNFDDLPRIAELAGFFPDAMRPMVDSLAREINQLIDLARRKLEQNRLLLRRLAAINNELLGYIRPDLKTTETYSKRGSVQSRARASKGGAIELTA